MALRTNAAGIALIKRFEGCSLTSYQDGSPAHIWTCGWGCTRGITPGMAIDQDTADAWLERDLAETESLLALPDDLVSSNQFSALVSFCYNVGFGKVGVKSGFRVLKNGGPSTMLMYILRGDMEAAATEFEKWDHLGGVVSGGLLNRRLAERDLFLLKDADESASG